MIFQTSAIGGTAGSARGINRVTGATATRGASAAKNGTAIVDQKLRRVMFSLRSGKQS